MSSSLNRIFLIGNLTRDPESKQLPSGTSVTELGLAVNESYTDKSGQKKDEVVYVDVSVFGQASAFISQYGSKGKSVFIEGKLRLETWDDKQTGQKRSKLKVVAVSVQLFGSRQDSAAPSSPAPRPVAMPQRQAPRPAPRPQPASVATPDFELDENGDPQNIPF
jgi:single-strand DNA-binding protein